MVVPETKIMTHVISSFPFIHCTWFVLEPVCKRNVLVKGERFSR